MASPPSESDADDIEDFLQWLSSTANAEGMSEAELVNEMLSYYWIVNELSKTVGEGSESPGAAMGSDDGPLEKPHVHPESSGVSSTEQPEEGDEPTGQPAQGDFSAESVEGVIEDLDRIERLVQSLQQLRSGLDTIGVQPPPRTDEASATPSVGTDRGSSGPEVDLEELQMNVDELQARQEEALGTMQETVEEIERQQERIASQAADDAAVSEIAGVQEAIVDEVTAIGSRLEQASHRHRTLESSHEQLEDRIEADFDDLESIITHLLETVSQLNAQLEDASTSHDADMEMLKYQLQKRQHLEELKREANREGVQRADCAECGQTCHLGLLETPFCPECGEQFASIEPTWVPFKNALLHIGGPLKK
jgi:uncharacterized phage infection (PIP) family protein YhgE